MFTEKQGPIRCAELEQIAERHILQRTWHRVHRLRVERIDDRMIVHGRASTHYVKQLALAAALEVAESANKISVELDIDVDSGHPHTMRTPMGVWAHA